MRCVCRYAYTWGPEHNDWVCDSTHEQAGECDRLWRKSRSMESYFPPDSSCIGVDLNRNFPVDFGERGAGGSVSHMCEANSPGFRAFSEPETKMVRRGAATGRRRCVWRFLCVGRAPSVAYAMR